jgi:Protein of unknown function (DUF3631)
VLVRESERSRERLGGAAMTAPQQAALNLPRDPTVTGAMLDAICAFVRRFVVLSLPQARIVALWIAHTHAIAAADVTPYLTIDSPEKQSGKTRLLEVCELLVANPWFTGHTTAAVLTRKIDAIHPTLLLDESDAAFGVAKECTETLRSVLNTGHRRGGKYSACVGQGAAITYRDFLTFCAKAIAGLGSAVPDTVADRSIPIHLGRKLSTERVERLRWREVEAEVKALHEQLSAWALTAVDGLRHARPVLPIELSDRQQEGAEPLLAIADECGGEWPEVARRALVHICSEAQVDDASVGVRLLADIRGIFEGRGLNRIPSTELAEALTKIETSSWGERDRAGNTFSANSLSRLLRRYKIKPHPVRAGKKVFKGYELGDFKDAFARYLFTERLQVTEELQKTAQNTNKNAGCNSVTVNNTYIDRRGGVGRLKTTPPSPPPFVIGPQTVTRLHANTDAGSSDVPLATVTAAGQAGYQPMPTPIECAICQEMFPDRLALSKHLQGCAPAPDAPTSQSAAA